MTTNSQLTTTEPNKQKLNKQPEEKKSQRNGDHIESYQQGWEKNGGWEMVQGIRSIIGRHKVDRGRLRIVQEMEKPNNLYV